MDEFLNFVHPSGSELRWQRNMRNVHGRVNGLDRRPWPIDANWLRGALIRIRPDQSQAIARQTIFRLPAKAGVACFFVAGFTR
jgi:hypothetical protein